MFCIVFTGNRWKTKTTPVQVLGIQFPIVKCLFQHLGQKLWEKIDFLQKKCNFSKHIKTQEYKLCVKYIM